jgi:hypothetical protein
VPRSFTEPGPDVPGLGSRARSGVCGCCRLIDKAWKIGGDAFESFVIHQIDGLDLEGLHKALGLGIVIGIATSDHFAGLDVSVKETSVCIVDDTGKIVREVKVPSEPEALLAALKNPVYHFRRIGLEAGPLSQWLYSALAEAELPVVCVETRHMQALLKAVLAVSWSAPLELDGFCSAPLELDSFMRRF